MLWCNKEIFKGTKYLFGLLGKISLFIILSIISLIAHVYKQVQNYLMRMLNSLK